MRCFVFSANGIWRIVGDRGATELGGRDHPAEIFVALAIGHQDVEPALIVERQLGADDRLEAGLDRGMIKARRAVKPVAIAERERG